MHVLLTYKSTRILVWGCRENNVFFHKRLPYLTVQVWSKINCLGWISRVTVAWSDANALGYCGIMLSSVIHTRKLYMAHKTCWINVENPRKIVVPLVLMNRHINQSRCERYIMSVEFHVWYIKKTLLCVLVYQKSKRKIVTYEFLDALKHNAIPYDCTQVNSRDI